MAGTLLAGRTRACGFWETVEICSIFKILVFPPATYPPLPYSSPISSLSVCISGIFQSHFSVNKKRLERNTGQCGQGYQGGSEGFWPRLEGARAGYLNQGPAPTPGPQAAPAKTSNDHNMYPHPVQCGLGTVPTTHRAGWSGHSEAAVCPASHREEGRMVPLRTEKGDTAE